MQNMNDPMRGFLEQLLSSWDGEPAGVPAATPPATPARASSVIRTLPETNAEEADLLLDTAVPTLSALAAATGQAVTVETPAAQPVQTTAADEVPALAAQEASELVLAGDSRAAEAMGGAMTPPPPSQRSPLLASANEPEWRFSAAATSAPPPSLTPAPPAFAIRPPSSQGSGAAGNAPSPSPWRIAPPAAPPAPAAGASPWSAAAPDWDAAAPEQQPASSAGAQPSVEPMVSIWRIPPAAAEKAPPAEAPSAASTWRLAPANPVPSSQPPPAPPPVPEAPAASIWRLTAAAPAPPPQSVDPAAASVWRIAPAAAAPPAPPAPQAPEPDALPAAPPPPAATVPPLDEDTLATASIWRLAPALSDAPVTETADIEIPAVLPVAQFPVVTPMSPQPEPKPAFAGSTAESTPSWKLSAQPPSSTIRLTASVESARKGIGLPETVVAEPVVEVPIEPEELPMPDWIQSPDADLPNLDELWPDDEVDSPAAFEPSVTQSQTIEPQPEPEPAAAPVAMEPAAPAVPTRSLVDFTSALAMLAASRRAAAGLPVQPAPPAPAAPAPEEANQHHEPEPEAVEAVIVAGLALTEVVPEPAELAEPVEPIEQDAGYEEWLEDPSAAAEDAQAALLAALLDAQAAEWEAETAAEFATEAPAEAEPAGMQPGWPAEAEAEGTLVEAALEVDHPAVFAEPELEPEAEAEVETETEAYFTSPPAAEPVAEPEAELGVELEWEAMAEPVVQPAPPASTANAQEDLATVVARLEASLPVAAPWDAGSEEQPRSEQLRHLVFSINDERFGVRLENLLEVDNMPMWTGIPGMPHTVRGLINLRGEIVSLLDLRAILGLPHPETPKRGKIFVAATTDRQFTSAFAVDDVDGISAFQAKQLKPVPSLTQNETSRHITATVEDGERLVRILDVAAILGELEQTFSLDMLRM